MFFVFTYWNITYPMQGACILTDKAEKRLGYTHCLSFSLAPSPLLLSLSLFLWVLLLEFLPRNLLREDSKQKKWEKADRAFLLDNGLDRNEASTMAKLTEHRWRLSARPETSKQEALAEACDARDKTM